MTLETLHAQLTQTEQELEAAKAYVQRCDGAIQLLQHLIDQEEKEEKV